MSEEAAEYQVEAKRGSSNTVIITEDNGGINSNDFWGYALVPYHQPAIDERDIGYGFTPESSGLLLIACRENKEDNIVIYTIGDDEYTRATRILHSLLTAIKDGERIWDITENLSDNIPF